MSPHLQVWRFHVTMLSSILHRITGVGIYLGALIVAAWAIALGLGPEAYGTLQGLLGSPLGKLVMFGMTASLFYHLGNGVRHIIWDFGHGLSKDEATSSSYAVFGFAIAATLAVWGIAFTMGLVV